MPIYKFKCFECNEIFEKIVKLKQEVSHCIHCKKLAQRIHGQDLPSPAQIEVGVGGVYRGKFGERNFQ